MSLQRFLLTLPFLGLLLGPSAPAPAQVSMPGQPMGLREAAPRTGALATVQLAPTPRTTQALAASSESTDTTTLLPHAYGTATGVAIDLKTEGTARRLPGGGQLWRLRLTAPGARGLRFAYDRFRLPPGATFFVYDARGEVVRGAFTARNNAPHGGFATALTPGEDAILEYYEPPDAAFEGRIRVASVVRAQRRPYAGAPLSDDAYAPAALDCSINTACPEGEAWTEEARATVLIDRGGHTCTGVLLNNTREDFSPYVLTAHHCGSPAVGDTLDWLVTFHHASPSCTDPETVPPPRSMAGVVVRAAASGWKEDYALLELLNPIPAHYEPYFAGWSRTDDVPEVGVTPNHPRGDLRKITFDDDRLTDIGARWLATFDRGTIEGGSSGAPLFNEMHRLVGHVRGAWALDAETCSGPGGDDNAATIVFPKFAHIWESGPPGARVADALDPLGSAPVHLDGRDGAPADTLAPPWISEVDTRTADTPEADDAEFVEIAGPAGLSLDGYRLDIYTCEDGRATRRASEVIETESHASLPDAHEGVGFFVLGGTGLDASFVDQPFSPLENDRLPDGRGLLLLRAPDGREVFDYQYDEQVDGTAAACPASRVTRSRGDDVTYGTPSATHSALTDAPAKSTLGSTAIGFAETPSASSPGTAGMAPSPGRANSATIPVELIRFEAVTDDATVQLSWTTASETNNAGFEVQMQEDGRTGAWKHLTFVEGAGTTIATHRYRHEVADLLPGRHTFRLRQIDYDGTTSLGPAVEAHVTDGSSYRLSSPHPNPFRQEATLILSVERPQHVEAVLYDVLGRRVAALYDGPLRADAPTSLAVNAERLPSGVYLVRVVGERFSTSRKVTLLR